MARPVHVVAVRKWDERGGMGGLSAQRNVNERWEHVFDVYAANPLITRVQALCVLEGSGFMILRDETYPDRIAWPVGSEAYQGEWRRVRRLDDIHDETMRDVLARDDGR